MLVEVGAGYFYSTIQNAINSSPDGGQVRVSPGAGGATSYAEAVLVNNKRIRLFGGVPNQGITIAGAGGGAAPALQVTGTGGVNVENFNFTNVGSAATYVVEMNTDQDWVSRCIIDGGGTARCLEIQWGDHILLKNGTVGAVASCAGSMLLFHCQCVNMTSAGFGGAGIGSGHALISCLTYNCNSLGFVNASATRSAWNFSEDGTAPGPDSNGGMSLADYGFVNYAGGDFRLGPNSLAYVGGISTYAEFMSNRLRLRSFVAAPRMYGGPFDPFPAAPVFLTGNSQLRTVS